MTPGTVWVMTLTVFSRSAVLLVFTLWLAPQVAALCGVEMCTVECNDEGGGIPCPPLCVSCSCSPNTPRVISPGVALTRAAPWQPVAAWWGDTTRHRDGVPTTVFHPPKA
jgi:hypothetical protein